MPIASAASPASSKRAAARHRRPSCCPPAAASPTRCSPWLRSPSGRTRAFEPRLRRDPRAAHRDRRGVLKPGGRAGLRRAISKSDCRDILGILQTVRADPLRRPERARPGRRVRRDLVDAAVRRVLRERAAHAGARGVARCARASWSSSGAARARRCDGSDSRASCDAQSRPSRRHARDHRLRRLRHARACRPRSAATAAISPAPSSARCSRRGEIHIWTDVDGVLSRRPAAGARGLVIDSLSYNEAMELAYFGAKVIHPQTMAPAIERGIPIWIRNTFAPEKARHADLRRAGLEAARSRASPPSTASRWSTSRAPA